MDWITIDSLKSVGGAALAVMLLVSVLKSVTGMTGRRTQLAALLLSIVIAVIIGDVSSIAASVVTLLNSLVIFAAAMGIDQAVHYKQ